jgi:hypothetical protein
MILGLGLGLGFSVHAGGFSPASLFGVADDGWYWEPSLDTTFTDAARTIPTTVGNAVGGVTDASGNANHGSQATAAARMVLRQAANGSYYYESDAVDDALQTGMNLTSKRMTVAMAFRPLARSFILLNNAGTPNPWMLAGQSGSASTLLIPVGTLNSIYFDNVLFTGTTRGQLYTAAQSAKSVIADVTTNADAWLSPSIGRYFNGGFHAPGDTFATLAIDREITAPERANITASFVAMVP